MPLPRPELEIVEFYPLSKDTSIIVFGAKKAAIYELSSGNVYWLSERGRLILEKFKKGLALAKRQVEFINKICKLGIQKLAFDEKTGLEIKKERYAKDFHTINIEVTSACNERCIHCYGAFGLSNREKLKDELTVEEQLEVIKEAKDLGFRTVQFIGGEPFIKASVTMQLIDYAKSLGFKWIQLYTNGTMITKDVAREIAKKNVEVKISLYGHSPEVHDGITRSPGSFERTMRGIKLLQSHGMDVRVGVPIMRQNQEALDEIERFLKRSGVEKIFMDPIRPVGRGTDKSVQPTDLRVIKYRIRCRPSFRTSYDSFIRFKYANSCLHGNACVTSFGDVIPCVEIRNFVIGNIRKRRFREIMMSNAPDKYWYTTKEDIETCRVCEFRYACFDCRALAINENFFSRGNCCTYDPFAGKWGQPARAT